MLRSTLTLAAFLSLSSACTIVYQVAPPPADTDTESGEDPPLDSSGEGAEETSTGDASTGDTRDASTGETATGETSTTGEETSAAGESTGEASTGETPPPPALLPLGAECVDDTQCKSGACIGSDMEIDIKRCSDHCGSDTPNDCAVMGSPGLCVWGGNQRWCGGYFTNVTEYNLAALPYQDPGFLQDSAIQVYLVPPMDAPYTLSLSSMEDPLLGPAVADLYKGNGVLVGTYGSADQPVIEPAGMDMHHWIIVRNAPDTKQSTYTLSLY